MEVSLNKAREGWKKDQVYLRKMRIENIDLFEECIRSLKDNYSILYIPFENVLR